MRDDKIKLTAVFTQNEAAAIRELARKDGRTVSNYIRKIVVDNLEEVAVKDEMENKKAQ